MQRLSKKRRQMSHHGHSPPLLALPAPSAASASSVSSAVKSTFEDDLSKAIEMSLVEQQHSAEQETSRQIPTELIRTDPSIPVGLRNVGNTCYVNSILQTYFHVPKFRQFVLGYRKEGKGNGTDNDPFMTELQRLFGCLLLSDRKWIDPMALVEAMNSNQSSGQVMVKIGLQDDLTSFNESFLSRLEQQQQQQQQQHVVAPGAPGGGDMMEVDSNISAGGVVTTPVGVTKELFYGKVVEMIEPIVVTGNSTNSDNSGGDVSTPPELAASSVMQTEQEFCTLIVNVSAELKDLHSSLDRYTSTETVEYRSQRSLTARKSTWIRQVPPVLVIQVQRTAFDAESKSAQKLTQYFDFPEMLYLERYMERNRAETMRRRERLSELSGHVDQLRLRLQSLAGNYESSEKSIVELFGLCAEFLERTLSGVDPNSAAELSPEHLARSLRQVQSVLHNQMDRLTAEIESITAEMSHVFDDMNSGAGTPNSGVPAYWVLHSALVHEGTAETGHYWNYYNSDWNKNSGVRRWIKFNDAHVSECTEQEVWERSTGGGVRSGSSAAYCLIYVNSAEISVSGQESPEYWKQLMPSELVSEIDRSNAELHRSAREYQERQLRRRAEQQQRFLQEFKEQWDNILAVAPSSSLSSSLLQDDRISSFAQFCASLQEWHAARRALAEEVFCRVFEVDHVSHQSDLFDQMLQEASSSVAAAAAAAEEDDLASSSGSAEDELKSLHEGFLQCSRYFCAALELIDRKDYDLAVEALQICLVLDSQFSRGGSESIRRRDDFVSYLALCVHEFVSKANSCLFGSAAAARDTSMGIYFARCAFNLIPFIVAHHTRSYVASLRSDFLRDVHRLLHDKWKSTSQLSEEERRALLQLEQEMQQMDVDELLVRTPVPPPVNTATHSFSMDKIPSDASQLRERIFKLIHDVENSNSFFFGSKLERDHSKQAMTEGHHQGQAEQQQSSSSSSWTWNSMIGGSNNNPFSVLGNNSNSNNYMA